MAEFLAAITTIMNAAEPLGQGASPRRSEPRSVSESFLSEAETYIALVQVSLR